MNPPGTTPAAGPASTPKSPSDVFAAAVTGDLKTTTKSNAPLDPNTIATLATGIVAAKPTVKTVGVSASATHFLVQYNIEGAPAAAPAAGGGPVVVLADIAHHTDAAAAQDVLRQFLATFDGDVAAAASKTARPLGQVSLQTGTSVFWVRDAIWVRLQAAPTTTTTPSPAPAPAGPPPADPVLEKLLLPLAAALDAHLAKHAVAPAAQLRPNTAVKTASYRGPVGKAFSFQLVDAKGTHALKPAEPVVDGGGGGGMVVLPLANGSPTGEYSFLGRRPGKGKVRLVVAREDTLAVGVAEVSVEIV
ncbi:hypothetical protein VTK56DRAFT_8806 [Thermocarpiscus australiensis]